MDAMTANDSFSSLDQQVEFLRDERNGMQKAHVLGRRAGRTVGHDMPK